MLQRERRWVTAELVMMLVQGPWGRFMKEIRRKCRNRPTADRQLLTSPIPTCTRSTKRTHGARMDQPRDSNSSGVRGPAPCAGTSRRPVRARSPEPPKRAPRRPLRRSSAPPQRAAPFTCKFTETRSTQCMEHRRRGQKRFQIRARKP